MGVLRSRYVTYLFITIAVGYALLAGLHTISDFDTGWQLATGRYVTQNHHIPSTDIFSYTARGNEWIYPPFAGVLLFGLYSLAGYGGLSWLCAFSCAATIAIAIRKGRVVTALVAILAVPIVADRISPRADLFTTLIFAIFLAELWRFRLGSSTRLWTLPLLMIAWVNLHPGFVAGLALIIAYLAIESLDMLVTNRREPARQRLRRAVPWLALTGLVTLLNPWGPKIYSVLIRQDRAMQLHSSFIGEWAPMPVSWRNMSQAFAIHSVYGDYWRLIAVALAIVVVLCWQKQLGSAVLMSAFIYFSFQHLRLQGLAAIGTVIIGGAVLEQFIPVSHDPEPPGNPGETRTNRSHILRVLFAATAIGILAMGLVKMVDLVSNRYYVIGSSTASFGTGESWWFPERAASAIEREELPGNIFHEYAMGGFVIFRLGPHYPDYVDGRAIPFDPALFVQQRALPAEAPDSEAWQKEADQRNINILLLSLSRFEGLGTFDLRAYCDSKTWRPVYLDEVSAVFLRNTPENHALIEKLQINCMTQTISPRASERSSDLFNFHSNAGAVFSVLGRDNEAMREFDQAQAIYSFDPMVHLMKAQLLQARNDVEGAEREYRASLAAKETAVAWYALGRLYAAEHRYQDAKHAIENSAELAELPFNNYKSLGQVELLLGQPNEALKTFDTAAKASPFRGEAQNLGNEFNAQIAQGRAEAWRQLGHLETAISFQQAAVQQTPKDAARWNKLADLYQSAGKPDLAERARQQASALQPHTPN